MKLTKMKAVIAIYSLVAKSMQNTTIAMAIAAFCALTAQAVVNPFGDSVFWWRGGRDGANGCAQDGLFTQGEFVDTRHAKDTTFWNQAFATLTNGGAADDTLLHYLTETVTAPYACESNTASTLYFPQTYIVTTNYSAIGEATNVVWRPQKISRLYLPTIYQDRAIGGVCSNWTAFIRFRRDGLEGKAADMGSDSYESLMLLNYNWGNKKGIGINFKGTNITQEAAQMRLSIGKHQPTVPLSKLTVVRGKWVDLAISVTGRVVTAYWCAEGGKFGSASYDETGNTEEVEDLSLSASSYIHIGTDLNLNYGNDCYAYDLVNETGERLNSNNGIMAFRGAIAQLAFWDRALDVHEVQEVFGYPRPAAMTVGVKDGGTAEYLAAATSVAAGNGSWEDLNPVLAAGASRTVSFMLTEPKAALPQLLRIFPATGSASGHLAMSLNGNDIGSKPFFGSRTFSQFVKAKYFVAGENTLTITRMDSGPGDVLFDALEMSGSYIVGRDSRWNNVFTHENEADDVVFAYDVTCGAETNLVHGVNPKKSWACGFSIVFPVDAEMMWAMKGVAYHTRVVSADSDMTVPFPAARYSINGHLVKEYAADEFPTNCPQYLDFDIPLEFLKVGTNTFSFAVDYIGGETSKWRTFSFHAFEMRPEPMPGLVFLVK